MCISNVATVTFLCVYIAIYNHIAVHVLLYTESTHTNVVLCLAVQSYSAGNNLVAEHILLLDSSLDLKFKVICGITILANVH